MSGPKRLFDEDEVLQYANAAYAQAIEAAAKAIEAVAKAHFLKDVGTSDTDAFEMAVAAVRALLKQPETPDGKP